MAISLQQLTIYLYSAHRAVIFAIAQLSCLLLFLFWHVSGFGPLSFTIIIKNDNNEVDGMKKGVDSTGEVMHI